MNDYFKSIQIGIIMILFLFLFNVLLPISIGWKIPGSFLICILAIVLIFNVNRRKKMTQQSIDNIDFLNQKLDLLPGRQRYRLPVLMVTGSAASVFFHQDTAQTPAQVIVSSDAIWIYVPQCTELAIMFDSLVTRWPEMSGRIGVFLAIAPELEDKLGVHIAKLQAFRQAWNDACRLAKYKLPVYVSAHVELNHLHYHNDAPLPAYWYQLHDDHLYLLDNYLTPIENWVNQKNISMREKEQRLHLQIMLREIQNWFQTTVISTLEDGKQAVISCQPVAAAIYPLMPEIHSKLIIPDNIISTMLAKITTLKTKSAGSHTLESLIPVPDQLVKSMPISNLYSPTKKLIGNLIIILCLFFLAALTASYYNNSKLIRQINHDIYHYDQIADTSYTEKYEALSTIKKDKTMIEGYFRNSEPIRLGFGLYQGEKLLSPLNAAISRYIPPPPPPEPPKEVIIKQVVIKEPEVIRLDSLALFESGKTVLKIGSEKVLINALMDIKNQINTHKENGWLILIVGHADATGDAVKNQQLSLERAAAVRNWMTNISDIPEACFAIQGYGAKNPLVGNDTAEERMQNRRVEISLVPQIASCL